MPDRPALFDAVVGSVDAAWLVAPETGRCLERLAKRIERAGTTLLGSGSATIRRASDKATLGRLLARHRVRYPVTRALSAGMDWKPIARELGYPLVVKPRRGAGCEGVRLARNRSELRRIVEAGGRRGSADVLLQQYVIGTAASVSLLATGGRSTPLALNAQSVRPADCFAYRGGMTPLEHPLAGRALDAARRVCSALPGLRGYVGIDLVLTGSEAVVIEVNPRLTTAYLGVREALAENVAALAVAACAGRLPAPPQLQQRVHFTASGRTTVRPRPPLAAAS
jgi:predicted ATP-grasp superfamily ATP-dependent carboligase